MKKIFAALLLALVAQAGLAQASFINYASREINCKIVYYGSARAGLHENLVYIYGRTNPEAKGKLIELATEGGDKTEFFDFLPLALGEIRGYKTRFHLYTTPGKAATEAGRLLILKGVDGIVFVADSDPAHKAEVLAAWDSLKTNLTKLGYDRDKMPLVVQLDHRDAPNALPVSDMKAMLALTTQPVIEAVPTTGVGVFDTLKVVCKLILLGLKRGESEAPAKQ